jgi:prepilin-type N-terminal cleavage/methylation domain-containing protein
VSARRGGFTLAELLAVLVVMGLAAAVAAPALRPPDEAGAVPAAAALREAYGAARGAAARRVVPVAVEVEAETGRWALLAELPDGARDTLREGRLPLGGATLAGGGARFTPLGRARAEPATFAGGGARVEVRVDPWTGWVDDARP